MTKIVLRWIGGGLALAVIVGAVLTVSQCRDNLREEGRQEVTQAIQQETIDNLRQDRERTDSVLVEREKQRAVNDATSKQTQKQLYEAKPTAYDIDSPLPDVIANPLRLQWEAISCGQGGEDATACRVVDGKAYP